MKKAFSFVEIFLVIVILGLLAAVFIPATVKIREKVRMDAIEKNLSMIVSAGQLFNSENGTKTVPYKTLVDRKFLPPLDSVSGENYENLSVESDGGILSVSTSLGQKIDKKY